MIQIFKIIVVLCIIGCTPNIQTVYVPQKLTHEPRPVLPAISGKELGCVSKETFQKIYDRNRLATGYAVYLETIIDSTNK